jgi:hypothetical protein
MNATQLLFLLIGVFIVVNAGNFLQVFEGKAKINVVKGSRTSPPPSSNQSK